MNRLLLSAFSLMFLYITSGCISFYSYRNCEITVRDIKNEIGVPNKKVDVGYSGGWGATINLPERDERVTDLNGIVVVKLAWNACTLIDVTVQDAGNYPISYEAKQELEKKGWVRIEDDAVNRHLFPNQDKREHYIILRIVDSPPEYTWPRMLVWIPGP